MTEAFEPIFQEVPKKEQPEEIKKVKIRCSVFFDGTLNNRTNIDHRLVSAEEKDLTEEEKKASKELKSKMTVEDLKKSKGIYKKYTGVGSYENGYTNIVKLDKYLMTDTAEKGEYDHLLKAYVEGAGTMDDGDDKTLGYAIGTGKSGVKKKVEKGRRKVITQLLWSHGKKSDPIEKLTLDVFGFSRGAATARYFIHKALLDSKSIEKQLIDSGYEVEKVEVCFAGLFDTVSSHGLSFSNDTEALKLDSVKYAKEVVHLTAADEHRENFSLTNIKSAGSKGVQIFLPGVHSDIGGSYREGASEDQDVYWTMGHGAESRAGKQAKELYDAGWYKKDELTIQKSRINQYGLEESEEVNLNAKRGGISNQYSRIPLHIMTRFARAMKIPFDEKLERDEKLISSLNIANQKINEYVKANSVKGKFQSNADDWLGNNRTWLKDLRYKFFHFSSRLELGNGPRFKDGKRYRMEYDG